MTLSGTTPSEPARQDAHAPAEPGARSLAAALPAYAYESVPLAARAVARCCLLDWLGGAIAGTAEPAPTVLRDIIGGGGSSTLIGGGHASPIDAARINGTAGHVLDFDDVVYAMQGHPTAPVMPAVLAAAEAVGADGCAALTAFIAGVETECRIGAAVSPSHYAAGFHSTATAGTFGAAAAVAHLLQLDAGRATHALGLAAISAAGLKSAFGSMGKSLQVGHAAAEGMLAAMLAARGATGPEDGIVGPQGFAATHALSWRADLAVQPVGHPWYIRQTLFKYYPSCYLTHASIEALVRLRAQGLRAEDVERVEIRVHPGHLTVCAISEPRDGLEGKFSLRYTAAVALVTGRVDDEHFTDASVNDSQLVSLRDRVVVTPVPGQPGLTSAVVVTTRDGGVAHQEVDVSISASSEQLPTQWDRLAMKFRSLVAPRLGDRPAEQIIEAVDEIDRLERLDELLELCTPPR
jgi:2-methylcitrate dehydratase PrpD